MDANIKRIQREIADLDNKGLPLQDWLNTASRIDPMVSEALEGIYCGSEGRVHEQLGQTRYWLTMTWYTVSTFPKVEVCYVS